MSAINRFSAEKDFIETLERIARSQSSGYSVLYVSLSKLRPRNRHPSFIKTIAKLFDNLVGAAEGSMFVFNNGDFVILGQNITPETIEQTTEKLRLVLADDPIWLNADSNDFTHLYFLPDDIDLLFRNTQNLIDTAPEINLSTIKYPVETWQMEGILGHLELINIAEIIKHQSVIRLENSETFKLLFQEFFVAVKDLSAQYDRTIDITGNKWLFLYLTQALDKRTISSFRAAELNKWPSAVSLNLHLSTVFSPEFELLTSGGLPLNQQVIAEVQMMDILNKTENYFAAKEKLHAKGNKILIDSLVLEALPLLNLQSLAPDYIKIFWNPMMEFDTDNQYFRQAIEAFGTEKVILAKCTNDKAIRWGVSYGIRNFQGPYIDNLETVLIRHECPDSRFCDTASCLKRRRLICGTERRKCKHLDLLEKILE